MNQKRLLKTDNYATKKDDFDIKIVMNENRFCMVSVGHRTLAYSK